jgi:hypothetical protein
MFKKKVSVIITIAFLGMLYYRLEVVQYDSVIYNRYLLGNKDIAVNSNMVENNIIDVTKPPYNAKGDGVTDDTEAIQKALNKVKKLDAVSVLIPAGTYKITKRLIIYKNTHIKMDDNTRILRCHKKGFFINGEAGDRYYGFKGNGNITIEGGILDGNINKYTTGFSAIGLAHGSNIKLANVVFRDVINGHAIDLNSCKNVLIDSCRFIGYKDNTSNNRYYFREAIQISNHTLLGFKDFGAYDGTPCEKVTVKNCYFGESGTKGTKPWNVGIGNHGAVHDLYTKEVNIINNTFKANKYTAVRLFKFNDCKIYGNTFEECTRGVTISSVKADTISSLNSDGSQSGKPQAGKNYEIKNNTFNNTMKEDIYAKGAVKGSIAARISGITITDNVFINRNNINNKKKAAIFLRYADKYKVYNNKIIDSKTMEKDSKAKNAIIIEDDCINGKISNNVYEFQ